MHEKETSSAADVRLKAHVISLRSFFFYFQHNGSGSQFREDRQTSSQLSDASARKRNHKTHDHL